MVKLWVIITIIGGSPVIPELDYSLTYKEACLAEAAMFDWMWLEAADGIPIAKNYCRLAYVKDGKIVGWVKN